MTYFSACLESGNSQGASLLLVSSSRSREAIYNSFNSLTQSMIVDDMMAAAIDWSGGGDG